MNTDNTKRYNNAPIDPIAVDKFNEVKERVSKAYSVEAGLMPGFFSLDGWKSNPEPLVERQEFTAGESNYVLKVHHHFKRNEEGMPVLDRAVIELLKHRVVKTKTIEYGQGEVLAGYIVDPANGSVKPITVPDNTDEIKKVLGVDAVEEYPLGNVRVFTNVESEGRKFKFDRVPVFGKAIFLPDDGSSLEADKEAFQSNHIKFI